MYGIFSPENDVLLARQISVQRDVKMYQFRKLNSENQYTSDRKIPELKAPSIFSSRRKHADGKEFRIIVAHVFERAALINCLSKPCTQSIYPLNEQKCTFRRLENLEINSRSRYFRLLYFFIYSACWKRGRSKNH